MKVNGQISVTSTPHYKKQQSSLQGESAGSKVKATDELQISDQAQTLLSEGNELKTAPTEKLDELRKSIDEGDYRVGGRAIAQKIYNSWFE